MHARAACRLESFGFGHVYRYAPGKADWRAAGLPMGGNVAQPLRAIDAVRRDVPTCALDASVGDIRRELEGARDEVCLVLGDRAVVLGRVRGDVLRSADDATPAEDIMEEGPTTIRADDELASLVERMQRRHVATIIVTDPDGRLVGLLHRDDAERLLGRPSTTP
jgi:CBS domain-containing protein